MRTAGDPGDRARVAAVRLVPRARAATERAPAPAPFPRRVRHYGGTTTVPSPPRRVALLSPYNELSTLLSLDVAPVQYALATAALPTSLWDRLDGLAARPDAVPGRVGADVSIDRVAAVRPDVIIGDPEAVAEAGPGLDRIAPVVTIPGTARGGWVPNLRVIGSLLGLEERARAVIDGTTSRLAALRELGFGGARTVAMIEVDSGYGGPLMYNDPGYQGLDILRRAGLELAPGVRAAWRDGLPGGRGRFVALPPERAAVLATTDVIVLAGTAAAAREYLAHPVVRRLPAVRGGRTHVVDDVEQRWALDGFAPIAVGPVESAVRGLSRTLHAAGS